MHNSSKNCSHAHGVCLCIIALNYQARTYRPGLTALMLSKPSLFAVISASNAWCLWSFLWILVKSLKDSSVAIWSFSWIHASNWQQKDTWVTQDVCGWEFGVWPFKWKLLSSTLMWYGLYHNSLMTRNKFQLNNNSSLSFFMCPVFFTCSFACP